MVMENKSSVCYIQYTIQFAQQHINDIHIVCTKQFDQLANLTIASDLC